MALHSLNSLRKVRLLITGLRRKWLRRMVGLDVADSASISLSARFVSGKPDSIHVGTTSLVAFKTLIMSVDTLGRVRPVKIRENCFIGGGSTINPGVTIGPNSIVGAGSVVYEDVPPFCIAAGNPARVIVRNAQIGMLGQLDVAAENSRQYWRPNA